MNLNVFDTETTGLPQFRQPSEHPCQPHLVEIAALLYSDDGTLVDSFDAIIKPEGWVSEPLALAAHGITHEMAMDLGIPERDALDRYMEFHARVDLLGAHNRQFDDRILRIALKRYRPELAEAHQRAPGFCTCDASTDIVNLPPTAKMLAAGFRKPKKPNVAEALKYFTGDDHQGAHRARADAEACARIYFAIKAREAVAA